MRKPEAISLYELYKFWNILEDSDRRQHWEMRKVELKEDLSVDGNSLMIEDLAQAAKGKLRVRLSNEAVPRIERSRRTVERWMKEDKILYGVTTGFGPTCDRIVPVVEAKRLQENLIRSHSAGIGPCFESDVVRAIMLCRLNVFAKGYSGVRLRTAEQLVEMINKGIHPRVPEIGSVGASGDLTPLAHIALAAMGEGCVEYKGRIRQSSEALREAGIDPLKLDFKEGLSLINGTSAMTGLAALAVFGSERLVRTSDIVAAMSLEGLLASSDAFDERVHLVKPHPGQIACAKNVRRLLTGSSLVTTDQEIVSSLEKERSREKVSHVGRKIQDAYSLRCIPQVMGAVRASIAFVRQVVETEMNSASDNPLVFSKEEQALHGGNFHGQNVSMAMDLLSIALTEIGNISERRTARLLDDGLSGGLPPFLTKGEPGLSCGLMGLQYVASSLVAENRALATPVSVQSIPTNANNQDIVSMGLTSARNATRILRNAERILAVELVASAQAIDFRSPEKVGRGTGAAYQLIREKIKPITEDRELRSDLELATGLISSGSLLECVEKEVGKLD